MNRRPWPLYINDFSGVMSIDGVTFTPVALLNPEASTGPELADNWNKANDHIKKFNKHRHGKTGGGEGGGGEFEIYPYDGVTPAHDNVPWVITNGVLLTWPGSFYALGFGGVWVHAVAASFGTSIKAPTASTNVVIGNSVGQAIATFRSSGRCVIPYRFKLPIWST